VFARVALGDDPGPPLNLGGPGVRCSPDVCVHGHPAPNGFFDGN
jgi:hypothetical protein